jgi:hypothetical protein
MSEDDADFCWIHLVVETPGEIRCGECFHWYANDEAMLEEFNAEMAKMGLQPARNVDDIWFCAHCSHDF